MLLVLFCDERIDGIPHPLRVGNRRYWRTRGWPKCPVFAWILLGLFVGGRLRLLRDPLPQRGELRRCQRLTFERHALGFIRRRHALQQEATSRIAGLDGCTTSPSFNGERGSIEPQASFLL